MTFACGAVATALRNPRSVIRESSRTNGQLFLTTRVAFRHSPSVSRLNPNVRNEEVAANVSHARHSTGLAIGHDDDGCITIDVYFHVADGLRIEPVHVESFHPLRLRNNQKRLALYADREEIGIGKVVGH